MKNYDLRKSYGISIEQYETMLRAQNGVCAICGELETRVQGGQVSALTVDHDHKTGKVRGLLCSHCNKAIGFLRERPELFERAKEYVERHRTT